MSLHHAALIHLDIQTDTGTQTYTDTGTQTQVHTDRHTQVEREREGGMYCNIRGAPATGTDVFPPYHTDPSRHIQTIFSAQQ